MAYSIQPSDKIWKEMNGNPKFNKFVGDTVTIYVAQGMTKSGNVIVPEEISEEIQSFIISVDSDDRIWVTIDGYTMHDSH